MEQILQIENLSCGYGKKLVLKEISFTVNKGEVHAIIGKNGSGKSTLLKAITRIITDNTGDIYFGNLLLNKINTWELKELGISWFVQGGMVFSTLKVKDHFSLALKGYNQTKKNSIIEECMQYFPILKTCMEKRGGNLSGGQKQMLSFSMLIAQQSKCWLLDEPTAGLSPKAVKTTLAFLHKMKQKKEISMILVEHNYPVAFDLADKVSIIKEGKLYDSYPKSIFQKDDFLDIYLYN